MLRKLTKKSYHSSIQKINTQLFINGKFVNAIGGKTFDTINPATEEVIAQVQMAEAADVNVAVAAARAAFDDGPWRRVTPRDRGNLMFKLVDLLEKNKEELIQLEALDSGKPVNFARAADVPLMINVFKYYAGWADKIHGTSVPMNGPFVMHTRQEPVGVCGQIIPWNFPLAMLSWKLGPVLATGCVSVMKTSEKTPLSALRFSELFHEAGFPDGVFNCLSGFGHPVGSTLAKHGDVDKVAFTGSTQVGLEIMRNSHEHNLKRISLELGGKSPNIIMDDADIDLAVSQAQTALFLNQGQCCIAGSRCYVQEGIYDEFVKRSVAAAKARVVGDPDDPLTDQGPQIDKSQFDKVMGYIEIGKAEGAKLECGGQRHGNRGYYIEPTVFTGVTDDMTIGREEIFGPVMQIMKFKTVDEVIKRANDSPYGLGAGVCTSTLNNAHKISNALRVGTVYVNCYDVFDSLTPFGGFKDSGIGRELGPNGMNGYLENKTVITKIPDDALM